MPRGYGGRSVPIDKYEGFHDELKHDLKDDDINDWHIVNFCVEQLNKQHAKPFFIACGLHKPHLPFAVPRKYYDLFPRDQIQLPPHREDDLERRAAGGRADGQAQRRSRPVPEVRTLEGRRAILPGDVRLHRHEHRSLAGRAGKEPLRGQHHHCALGRSWLVVRREEPLAEVRGLLGHGFLLRCWARGSYHGLAKGGGTTWATTDLNAGVPEAGSMRRGTSALASG